MGGGLFCCTVGRSMKIFLMFDFLTSS
uniref:Uncharacterized protein n=1 Tax=Anguilla anguilla TaxID=7936 RepID=A0A0E9SU18_ANGAN